MDELLAMPFHEALPMVLLVLVVVAVLLAVLWGALSALVAFVEWRVPARYAPGMARLARWTRLGICLVVPARLLHWLW